MTSKIFKSILSVAIAVLLACLVVITAVFYKHFDTIQREQLRESLGFAANAAGMMGEEYLACLESEQYRLTWVSDEGVVLFDSGADASLMENHSDREEIRQALTTGEGSSSRRSATLLENTVYEAVRLNDGSVLRISAKRATAVVLVLGMLQPIALLIIVAIALSAWLAHRMAKRVVEPLNKLDLENPMYNLAYDELSPLLRRLNTQHQEIKRQMRELKRKQDELDRITGSMREALVLLDANGKVISINPAAMALFDADAVSVGYDFLALHGKLDMRQAVNTARLNGHAEFRAAVNGREYQFDLSVIKPDGILRGMVILAFDVTEQVNAERNRREFSANVSHELKTPLQSIIGSAELLENGIVKPEDIPRFVGRIRQEASRLVSLINDIIRLSQLDEQSEMPKEEVSLRALCEEAAETLADAAKQKNVTLTVKGDDAVINGVQRLLYEVIYNLCDNAINYNKPGGSVEVSITDNGKEACLSVSDTGIGIEREHQERIFERFYRVDKSHSRQSGGTGLGLSIVKHAVQYHHGKIDVDSVAGEGTTISITFKK